MEWIGEGCFEKFIKSQHTLIHTHTHAQTHNFHNTCVGSQKYETMDNASTLSCLKINERSS